MTDSEKIEAMKSILERFVRRDYLGVTVEDWMYFEGDFLTDLFAILD